MGITRHAYQRLVERFPRHSPTDLANQIEDAVGRREYVVIDQGQKGAKIAFLQFKDAVLYVILGEYDAVMTVLKPGMVVQTAAGKTMCLSPFPRAARELFAAKVNR